MLQDAPATCAQPQGAASGSPILDMAERVAALKAALNEVAGIAQLRGITLETIVAAQCFVRLELIDDAIEAFLATEIERKASLQMAGPVARLFEAVLPDARAGELAALAVLVSHLAAKMRAETEPPEIPGGRPASPLAGQARADGARTAPSNAARKRMEEHRA